MGGRQKEGVWRGRPQPVERRSKKNLLIHATDKDGKWREKNLRKSYRGLNLKTPPSALKHAATIKTESRREKGRGG